MNTEKNIQLFCLPYSGGKASVFNKILYLLNPNIDSYAVEYAGKETRSKEPFFEEYEAFINDLAAKINEKRDLRIPCAIFGYSIGALFAYDLAVKSLIVGNLVYIFLGGCCSASLHSRVERRLSDLPENEFWKAVIDMGGVRKELLKETKFLKIFSKPLRADFRIGEQYTFNMEEGKAKCDATILYSGDDTPYIVVESWKDIIEGEVIFELYRGDHFFAFDNYERTASIINKRLEHYI